MNSYDVSNRFRALHNHAETPLILPNIWDAGGAVMAEHLGAKAIATTSAGVAWSLGYGDGNKLPVEKLRRRAEEIVNAVNIPVSIDVEAGYSDDPVEVIRHLAPIFEAGVVGINIEDGRDPPELLAHKIDAIKRWLGASDIDVFVNARTDVYLANLAPDDQKVDEVLRRQAMYRSAGADGLFVPCLANEQEIKSIAGASSLPLNVMAMPNLLNANKLAVLGVRRLSAGSGVSQAAWKVEHDLIKQFLATGDSSAFSHVMSFADLQKVFASEL